MRCFSVRKRHFPFIAAQHVAILLDTLLDVQQAVMSIYICASAFSPCLHSPQFSVHDDTHTQAFLLIRLRTKSASDSNALFIVICSAALIVCVYALSLQHSRTLL